MENYNVDYFIEKFKTIPENGWVIGHFNKDNSHCALGHCGRDWGKHTEESNALTTLFQKFFGENSSDYIVLGINDSINYHGYNQETSKQRILAVLCDIKNKEEEDEAVEIVNNIIKEEKLELV